MPKTISEIRAELQGADRVRFEALSRALAADERKGVRAALETACRRLEASEKEAKRLTGMYEFQRALAEGGVAVGLDEVGRGPVAGPLAVAAVVLPDEPRIEGLNDSKQVPPERREDIAAQIKDVALVWVVEYVEPAEIDEHGMASSLRFAFSKALAAVESRGVSFDAILLDGNPLRLDPRERNVVKGDAKCASIAAASIVAKVERDALMTEYSRRWPEYGFERNKGYASADHIEAIKRYGLSPVHRSTFCRAWTQEALF